jgi:hypothetical protein
MTQQDLTFPQAPKKDKKDEGEEDKAFKEKKKAEADALKAAREKGKRFQGYRSTRLTTRSAQGRATRWRNQKVST